MAAEAVSNAGLDRDVMGRLLSVARHLGATADLPGILGVIIDAMRDTLGAERATVFEYDSVRQELFTNVAHGVAEDAAARTTHHREIRFPISIGIAGECARTRRIITVPEAYADPRFNPAIDRETGFRTRSILTIPLLGHDGELIGVAQVLNKISGPFDLADEEIAAALASQAAVALKRGRLILEALERQRLVHELELARQIQQSSFPQQMPLVQGFEIAGWSEPATETGGDAYDVAAYNVVPGGRTITDGCDAPASHAMLLMADATGHGVGPALSVTQVCSMFRMGVRMGGDHVDTASLINQQMCGDLPSGRFVTAWFGQLDGPVGALRSFSAGQAPLLVYTAANGQCAEMGADACPLGIVPDFGSHDAVEFHLGPGDVFAVISDGVYESMNAAGELMGSPRVQASIAAAARAGASAEAIVAAVRTAAAAFRAGREALDDQTMIIIKRI